MKFLNLFTIALVFTSVACNQSNDHSDSKKIVIEYITKNDSSSLLMKEDQFWKIIENSGIASNDDYQEQIHSLTKILTTFDPDKIVKFSNTFTALLAGSYDYKLWGASYVINGGCSDDCFDYFREYLIAHGKEKFYSTLTEPESCAGWIKSEDEDNWEGIRYSAFEAYKQKTGKDMPVNYSQKFELKGKPFDEGTVDKQYPKLAKKFYGKYGE